MAKKSHKAAGAKGGDDIATMIEAELQKKRDAFEAQLDKERNHLVEIATLRMERKGAQIAWNEAEQRLRDIDRRLAKLEGREHVAPTAMKASSNGKRVRRGEAELKEAAQKVYDFLRTKGKEGAGAKAILQATGMRPKAGENYGDLVKMIDKKVETTGNKATTTYYAS